MICDSYLIHTWVFSQMQSCRNAHLRKTKACMQWSHLPFLRSHPINAEETSPVQDNCKTGIWNPTSKEKVTSHQNSLACLSFYVSCSCHSSYMYFIYNIVLASPAVFPQPPLKIQHMECICSAWWLCIIKDTQHINPRHKLTHCVLWCCPVSDFHITLINHHLFISTFFPKLFFSFPLFCH